MKTKLLFTLLLALVIQFTYAQMTITQNGDIVTFTFDDNTSGDVWDANGNPINLYSWIDAVDTSDGNFNTIFGGWPGTVMTDNGGNIYELSVDLSTYYPNGTLISEIKYILNGVGGQTADLLGTAAGYTPFTLSLLRTNQQNNELKFINGKLLGNNNVVYNITVYNILGQITKSYKNQNLSQNNGLDLGLAKNQIFIIRTESVEGSKFIKIISK